MYGVDAQIDMLRGKIDRYNVRELLLITNQIITDTNGASRMRVCRESACEIDTRPKSYRHTSHVRVLDTRTTTHIGEYEFHSRIYDKVQVVVPLRIRHI